MQRKVSVPHAVFGFGCRLLELAQPPPDVQVRPLLPAARLPVSAQMAHPSMRRHR
jgi:hypothetical protein